MCGEVISTKIAQGTYSNAEDSFHCIFWLNDTTSLTHSSVSLQECGHHLLAGYSWELVEPDVKLDYKTLPVLRPVKDVQALFRKKINNNSCQS